DVYEKHVDLLNEIGKTVIYLGEDGNGHKMKLAVNLFMSLTANSFSEALAFAEKQGLDARSFVDTINKTPHSNYITKGKGPKILEGDYAAAFSLSNLIKDLGLVSEQIKRTGAVLPLTEVAIKEYSEAMKGGQGSKDFSVIAREIELKNGLR
ncbi:MAG: NAD(P)-dependent oxidoreductase, partial [Candidatus Saccharibacteria bacterium]